MRATQRIFLNQEAVRAVESMEDWKRRQDRFVEHEARRWLAKAETEAERDKVLFLYKEAIERMKNRLPV